MSMTEVIGKLMEEENRGLFKEGKDPLAVLPNDIYDEAYEEASQEQQQVEGNQEDVKNTDPNADRED